MKCFNTEKKERVRAAAEKREKKKWKTVENDLADYLSRLPVFFSRFFSINSKQTIF